MRQIILIGTFAIFLLTACTPNRKETLHNFLLASNRFDKEKIKQLLTDSFIAIDENGNKSDKTAFLKQLDSLKNFEINSKIISSQDLDSIIETKEQVTTIVDSLLEVNPKMVVQKKYKIEAGKISMISIDTTLNTGDYTKSVNEKITPFVFWLQDIHENIDQKQVLQGLKKYLTEYRQLSISEKKKYKIYSQLQGTYISNDNPFYRKLIFKGKSTVVTVDAIFGFSFPSSYALDEGYIRIRTDKSDLLLQIKDNNTLMGEGFASGTFSKVK